MIQKPTVLIIGAGASIDFGFPSGWGLVDCICASNSVYPAPHAPSLTELGHTPSDCTNFIEALHDSGAESVDQFLEGRPDLIDIGKALIAVALIPNEHPAALRPTTSQGSKRLTWLNVLATRMRAENADKWRKNQLTIVTFNYDRVVEHFLFRMLESGYGLQPTDAAQLLRSTVPIIHVHGQLGILSDLEQSPRSRPFQPDLSAASIQAASANIRIVHEADTNQLLFDAAQNYIRDAQEVVFLGFGFGEANMQRLNLATLLAGKTVRGSSYGMSPQQRDTARTRCEHNITLLDVDQNRDLVNFLNQYPILGN